jgi:enamine deaminase RidA (YjgF/YER057c/UK114 family)
MIMQRRNISSGAPWEAIVGYSRAVRMGPHVFVSGTTASDETGNVHGADVYTQTVYIFTKIERALHEAGASLTDVVRVRMYVTDISQWQEAGRAHAEKFAAVRPAATMVEVSRLIDPAHLIEIEVDAIIRPEAQ